MHHVPLIKSVMTPFPYSIDIDTHLDEVDEMMAEHGIRHLPVKEDGRIVGVIINRDIKLTLDPSLVVPPANRPLRARDVCSRDVYVVDLMERLDSVLLYMAKNHIGSTLVMKGDRLAGIFTTTDACRCYGEYLRSQFPPSNGNDAA